MFFWWICRGESVLPVLLLRHLPPFPISSFQSWITLYDLSLSAQWQIHFSIVLQLLIIMQDPSKQDFTCFVHFPIFKHMQIYVLCSVSQSDSLRSYGLKPAGLSCPWDFSGKFTEVGCHFLLQGISQPRDWTRVSHVSYTADRFFTTEPLGKPCKNMYTYKFK